MDERSVYFGYDQFSVPDKYDSMLMAHAAYLMAHRDIVAEVQGNCDERGSDEYNLALGKKRAEAAKSYLVDLGIDSTRIATISYGEERPKHDNAREETRRLNRRAALVVKVQ